MISIPEPCHEYFTKMTPTQRGAFCAKCSIDTFDFRNLSTSKINTLLLTNKDEHLCGRFTNKQLVALNNGFENWKNQKKKTFKSKFILALIFVFGLTLFSCNTQGESEILALQTITLFGTDTSTNYVNEVKQEDELDLCNYLTETEEQSNYEKRGMISIDLIVEEEEEYVLSGEPIFYREDIGGTAVAEDDYMNYLEDTVGTNLVICVPQDIHPIGVRLFEISVFPNPTSLSTNLAINVEIESEFEIALYNLSGKRIKTIYKGILEKGRQVQFIPLNDLQTGIYLVKVIANGQSETLKIEKTN